MALGRRSLKILEKEWGDDPNERSKEESMEEEEGTGEKSSPESKDMREDPEEKEDEQPPAQDGRGSPEDEVEMGDSSPPSEEEPVQGTEDWESEESKIAQKAQSVGKAREAYNRMWEISPERGVPAHATVEITAGDTNSNITEGQQEQVEHRARGPHKNPAMHRRSKAIWKEK